MTTPAEKFFTNALAFDCEVYPNYFLVAFKNKDTGKSAYMEIVGENNCLSESDRMRLSATMQKKVTFGFNSINFDNPIIAAAIRGSSASYIYKMADTIINKRMPIWKTYKEFNLREPKNWNTFDVMDPAPGVKVSLKLYGGRMHSKRLQDLPIEVGSIVTAEQIEQLRLYCINDLDTTIDLFNNIKDAMLLRHEMSEYYGQNLLSKSDAQIAEAVIKSELGKITGKTYRAPELDEDYRFVYKKPDFIKFETEQLNEVLEIITTHEFEIDGKGSLRLPSKLSSKKITMGRSVYKIGIGGLHSQEKAQIVVPGKHEKLKDKDVTSFYPFIILNLGLYPEQLGPKLLDPVYKNIVFERVSSKQKLKVLKIIEEIRTMTSRVETLKIVINGSFGKFGSKYSILYAPDLMGTVTLTGQLVLLMLIERLELAGINVVSANTDGFVSLIPNELHDDYQAICKQWEKETRFELEETEYSALYSRDVNNYFAVTTSGKKKGKGIFTLDSLKKNPAYEICQIAAMDYLVNGTDILDTLYACDDIKRFLSVRTVAGGAVWRGKYLGRVVRWIYSTDGDIIRYKKNGNKVPKSDGARPIMELGEFPTDIDYKAYVEETVNVLQSLGLNTTLEDHWL